VQLEDGSWVDAEIRSWDRDEIEALSLARLRRIHHEPHPYWSTAAEAATVLGVSYSNVPLMMMSDRLPYETAANGRRYVRQHRLGVMPTRAKPGCSTRPCAIPHAPARPGWFARHVGFRHCLT
jgi:hypothetical protein